MPKLSHSFLLYIHLRYVYQYDPVKGWIPGQTTNKQTGENHQKLGQYHTIPNHRHTQTKNMKEFLDKIVLLDRKV